MERFLLAVDTMGASQVGGGQTLLGTIKIAVLPIAKVFTMCFLGFLMASKYVNILPASGRKLLNGLVFSLLLPCLIFSQLGQAVTLQKMLEWWFIPVNVVLSSICGSLIGFIVASIVRPPYPFFKFSIIQIGIDGTAYISFGQWVGAIILYTYVFNMLAPPPEGTFDIDEPNLPIKKPAKDAPMEQVPLLAQEEAPAEPDAPKRGKIKQILVFIYDKLKLKQILQPPIIASILAMFLGAVPFLKQLIFTTDSPLFFFTDSCNILGNTRIRKWKVALILNFSDEHDQVYAILSGMNIKLNLLGTCIYLVLLMLLVLVLREAMIPCILLALGGNLVDGPGSSKLGFRTTAAIIFGRLVLVPPAGLGIVMLADKLGFLPAGDKMFRFVLLLQHTMPTSVLSGAVANLRGCGREAAAVLFWVHIFAIFSMAGWIVLYLNLLF
ncbi:hypothetical protein POTOM_053151 [Populus tomentosa]|uniref:Auxin efflux carrier family protein n=1 Tax=Populus tomentosa TaxID=118781 RepID=A0A8X8C7W2_POPTO|nr:hypothetical protein POTOM_053151 [Populus tomentosa]